MRRLVAMALTFCAGVAVVQASALTAQGPPVRSVWTGVYSEAQAARGGPMYAQYCGSCHGSTLEGGEMAPPLAGGAFNANWNGLTLGDILERIRITMPANSPGRLTRQQNVDVLAFMLSAGGFPQGQADLPLDTPVLKQIAFDASKP